MHYKKSKSKRLLSVILGIGFISTVTAMAVSYVSDWLSQEPVKQKKIQTVTLIKPPIEPPKPKIERPPEPEIEEVKIPDLEEPVPDIPDAPPAQDLGLDADGSAGGDNYGLIARRGGRSLLDGGRFGWYGHMVKTSVHDALKNIDAMKRDAYTIKIRIWINSDGTVKKVALENSTGVPDIDNSIIKTLKNEILISQAPPDDLPQPLRLKISTQI